MILMTVIMTSLIGEIVVVTRPIMEVSFSMISQKNFLLSCHARLAGKHVR